MPARSREAGDAKAVKAGGFGKAGRGTDTGDAGDSGSATGADSPGAAGGAAASGGAAAGSGSNAGQGQSKVKNESAGSQSPESAGSQDKPKVALPDDIPADGSGEDQVARQIREAALAEKDPKIREALWTEYRRQMGIKKK
jgi:hypothetical protein